MHFQRSVVRRTIAVAIASGLALLVPVPATAAPKPPPQQREYAYISSLDGHVYPIDTSSNEVREIGATAVGGGPDQVAITPDNTRLYVTNAFRYVSAINIAKRSVTDILYDKDELSPDSLYGEAMAPDGKHVYVAVQNPFDGDKVSVIDTATNQASATIKVSRPDQVAIDPGGKRLYVADSKGSLYVIDTADNQLVATIRLNEAANGMAISLDGKRLYATGDSGDVSVINLAKQKIVRTITGAGTGGLAISPNGKRAYVAGVNNKIIQGKVSVVNLKTNKVIKTIPIGDIPPSTGSGRYFRPSKVGLTPDGKSAYVVGSYGKATPQGTVFAINTATGAATPITVGANDTMGVAVGRL